MTRRRYISTLALIALFALPAQGNAANKATLAQENQVKPACATIQDGQEWAKCMERFKDVRPKHEPTKLLFDDWRNP